MSIHLSDKRRRTGSIICPSHHIISHSPANHEAVRRTTAFLGPRSNEHKLAHVLNIVYTDTLHSHHWQGASYACNVSENDVRQ